MKLALSIVAFASAWWLGLYLIARGPRKALLLRTGVGLLAYGLALACASLGTLGSPALAQATSRMQSIATFLPALLWTGATLQLLPEASTLRGRLDRLWLRFVAPATVIILVGAVWFGDTPVVRWLLAGLVLLPLLGALALVMRARRTVRPANTVGLLGAATLFFLLGFALLVLPLGLLSPSWALLAIGGDLALLGVVVARYDAFDEGEALRGDMLRSLLAAEGAALLFGGQVALAFLVTGHEALVALLFSTVAFAIAVAVVNKAVQQFIDRLAFANAPQLQHARAELRESAEALPRVDATLPLADLDDAEFARLTRRALSHYGDLPKLASSPLTQLASISDRLAARGVADHPLERAGELKALLAESINRLKPRDGDFGTSDAWRHYNALYYPYVVGLRPYSRRIVLDDLDTTTRRAFDWFNSQVPERTLHNWQNAAARLVAHDLRLSRPHPALVLQPDERHVAYDKGRKQHIR